MLATVRVPNSSRFTTRLGVGLATLMREPSASMQQRLLHVAYDAGFRHYDVAPSYGLGSAEATLGKFLRTRPAGVSIATKVGIRARGNAGLMRVIQRPVRAVLRRFPSLRGRATQAVGSVVHSRTDFSIAACRQSLERSRRALGLEQIDFLLLHEVQPADLRDGSVLDWLGREKARGAVLNVGIATSPDAGAAIMREYGSFFDAVQVPSHSLSPASSMLGYSNRWLQLTHGAVGTPLMQIRSRMGDPSWAHALCEHAGADISAPGEIARLLIALALLENPDGIVLVGTSKPEHLRSAAGAVAGFDPVRLRGTGDFLRLSFRQGPELLDTQPR